MTSTQSGFNRSLGRKNIETTKEVIINSSQLEKEPMKSNLSTSRKPPAKTGNYYNYVGNSKSPSRSTNPNSLSISKYSTMSTKFGKHSTIDSFLKGS